MADAPAVYDVREMIGSTRWNWPHTFVAKSLDGTKLGTFRDQTAATHAFREAARGS